jgi:DNA-binding transcriptional regulator GbsR (MarR family)
MCYNKYSQEGKPPTDNKKIIFERIDTMANKKMTYSTALEQAIAMLTSTEGASSEVIDKLTALKVTLDKKNASPKKQTAQQRKNAEIKEEIANFLAENKDSGFTVSDILKEVPVVQGDSNQHVSALMRQLVQDNIVQKYSEKRRTYFKIAD